MTALALAQSALNHAIALTPILFIAFVILRELSKINRTAPRVAAPSPPAAPVVAPPEPAPPVEAPIPQPLPKTVAAMRLVARDRGMRGAVRANRAQLLAFFGG